MKYMKEYAAANTVLHEHTHSSNILGERYNEDLTMMYNGRNIMSMAHCLSESSPRYMWEETEELVFPFKMLSEL
ncbi:hypothetical protein N7533_013204 [Penicillium manginii]|uniref:uncharacterized protein n=1 Tax=Penicillium manginii TaxID=203109 RepID=UPI00254847E1|nr:uncharacterized protein N7533_013204 [Penicillium manginii]KAJ5734801.1 hypothetical protein N7533_013204 [Penicillium manginii]